jgi:hypothetical protein
MCVLIFCTSFVENISNSKRDGGDSIISVHKTLKYLLPLSDFNET